MSFNASPRRCISQLVGRAFEKREIRLDAHHRAPVAGQQDYRARAEDGVDRSPFESKLGRSNQSPPPTLSCGSGIFTKRRTRAHRDGPLLSSNSISIFALGPRNRFVQVLDFG
jgi:hypothetical protein